MIQRFLGIAFAAVLALPAFADDSDSSEPIQLRYRSYRNWTIHLPNEQWFPVKDGIKLSQAGGSVFAVAEQGNNIKFDTDGDGELDREIKPLVDPKTNVSSTRVILSGKTKSGESFRYAARLRKDTSGWEWAPGGAMAGSLPTEAGPMPIRIIDRDGNGRFDDIGSDAMIVGTNDNATLLSKTVFVDGKINTMSISDNGQSIRLAEFQGPTSEIDMTTSFNSKAVLLSSVIVSENGQHSFDVGAIEGAIKVPAGKYRVFGGILGLGEHRVYISAGRMNPLELAADETKKFDWGGPIASEFEFARVGDKVQFSPNHIWYYGKAGEQYSGWNPIGKSPEFKVLDADTGAVLEVAILPGSC